MAEANFLTLRQAAYRAACKETKLYHCEKCNKTYDRLEELWRHENSKLHNPERYVIYKCAICPEHPPQRIKKNFEKHCLSRRHQTRVAALPAQPLSV